MITCNTAYRASVKAKSVAAANAGGEGQVFKLKKNGDRSAKAHEMLNKSKWTKEEGEAEAARMMRLNPNTKYVFVSF